MVDFTHFSVRRGTLIWIAPGQVQHFDDTDHLDGYLVLFQPEVGGTRAPRARRPTTLNPPPGDFELLESLAELMLGLKDRELSTPHDRLTWRLFSAMLELYEGALEHYSADGNRSLNEAFEAFDTLLDQNFATHREVSWYARRLGHTEKTLSRWCRKAVGIGAKAHIDRRVGLEAKRLLVHSGQTIDQISSHLGFSESTNFVKFFKRLEGVTPSAFRASFS